MSGAWPAAHLHTDSEGRRLVKRNAEGAIVEVGAMLNFQKPSVESSLVRNGKVGTSRATHGGDMNLYGVAWDPQLVTIKNARLLPKPASLTAEGFQLMPHDTGSIDLALEDDIVRKYYPSVCELVKRATGASRVVAFDHNIRTATGKKAQAEIKGGAAKQSPAHLVHTDYTRTGGPQRLRDLTAPAKVNDTWKKLVGEGEPLISEDELKRVTEQGGYYAIINVWRNVKEEPVENFPLAVCESRTTDPKDLVTFEIHYQDRVGENYFSKHNPSQSWFYYPLMKKAEALVFKQWDSRRPYPPATPEGALPTFCLHSAFHDPSTRDDAPDRESIEVRCIALFYPEDIDAARL